MCSASTIIYMLHVHMWTFRWTLFKFYSKSQKRREYVQLIRGVCTFFSTLSVLTGKGAIWEVRLGDIAAPPRMTPTMSIPPDSHQILASAVRRRWAVYASIWFEVGVVGPTCWSHTLALGHTHWHWVVHAGVGLYMWAVHAGVWLKTGSRHWCWWYTLAFGSKRRCCIVHAGVGPHIVALGCTHHFLRGAWSCREGMIMVAKRGQRHTKYRYWCLHLVPLHAGSYAVLKYRKVTRPGIEPRTFWTYTRCSNQLSYLALEFNQLILYLCNCQSQDTYSARHI